MLSLSELKYVSHILTYTQYHFILFLRFLMIPSLQLIQILVRFEQRLNWTLKANQSIM